MTMYLPNPDVRRTGWEPAEFIEAPPTPENTSNARGLTERRGTTSRLDLQTRLNIVRWADEYISGLVEDHNGGRDDVRSIIHQLHDQSALTDPDSNL
jgi:hypothetical protein